MPDANYFRELARRCCTLAKAANVPEIKEQLRVWAVEFADQADEAERRAAEREGPEAPHRHVR
jgi:thiaminase